MPLVLITSDRFADHVTPPGHPERVERAEAMQVVAARWERAGRRITPPTPIEDEDLRRVHSPSHMALISRARGRPAILDADTFMSPDSDDVARLAAGAVVTGVKAVMNASGARAFAMVRPPGHHAEASRAMGFCLYNSVAVAAAWARAQGASRVAIVDYDVHHGNGTQWIFYDDPAVLFVSSHQYPFYPGTGAAGEKGKDAGIGYTINLPLDAGATDADVDMLYRQVAVPALHAFRPDVIIVSAGFDAHERDPLGGLRMTTEGFAVVSTRLLQAADDLCSGRIVFVTEGGYDTSALAECCQMLIERCDAGPVERAPAPLEGDTRRAEQTLEAFRRAHRRL